MLTRCAQNNKGIAQSRTLEELRAILRWDCGTIYLMLIAEIGFDLSKSVPRTDSWLSKNSLNNFPVDLPDAEFESYMLIMKLIARNVLLTLDSKKTSLV
jgi:hypothetical protein